MKIGILGGSFDPPHFGHSLIVHQIMELKKLDQIWLMPNYSTSSHHKVFQKTMSSTQDRIVMTKFLEDQSIKVSDFELTENKKSLTITTLQTLTNRYPQHTFYWITGSDKLETFHLWDDWQSIIKNYHLIIFPRDHEFSQVKKMVKKYFKLQTIPKNVIVLDNKKLVLSNVSSTIVRERVKKRLPIDFLVPKVIERYIERNKLYEG